MRYHALACDYDGTLAHNGHVAGDTLALLEKLLATGRKLEDLLGIRAPARSHHSPHRNPSRPKAVLPSRIPAPAKRSPRVTSVRAGE